MYFVFVRVEAVFRQVGACDSGGDCVDVDVVPGENVRHAARHSHDSGFHDAVAEVPAALAECADGGDVDDLPATRGFQKRDGLPREIVDGVKHQRAADFPVFFGAGFDCFVELQSRVVYEDVKPAERFRHFCDESAAGFAVSKVGGKVKVFSAECVQFRQQPVRFPAVRYDGDRASAFRQSRCHGAAESAPPAGYDCPFA